jgi:16S rRNA pseudouridine516 synthase
MRIDKFLAHNNFGTRKTVRQLLKQKRVRQNETLLSDPSTIINPETDIIYVDDQAIFYQEDIYIMMNKPQGYECTHTPNLYPSVLELLDFYREDLIFVGRLDVDTEGLLLITNDGQFSHKIAHGKKEIYKDYYVKLAESFDLAFVDPLNKGITLDEKPLKPAYITVINDNTIILSIAEGKYHQVKRMMHYCHNEVTYLKRIKIGKLALDDTLEPGYFRDLSQEEIDLF